MTYNEVQKIKKCIKLLSTSGKNTKLQVQNILVGMLNEQPSKSHEEKCNDLGERLGL